MIRLSTKSSELESQTSFEKLKQENERILGMLEQYKAIFTQSLDAVVVLDSKYLFTEMNEAACSLFELPKEDLIGQSFLPYLVLESTKNPLVMKSVLQGEVSIRLASGKVLKIMYSISKNQANGSDVLIMRDISRKNILERQRNVSKQLFMDVYNRAVDGIVIFDRKGRFINSNESFMRNFELTKDKLLESTIYDFVEEDYLINLENLWRNLDDNERAKGEIPVTLGSGSKKIFEYTTTANIFDKYYMSIMRDVTERKGMEEKLRNSELRFREIFDTALDAIVIWNDEGNIISANNSASKIFELPLERLINGNLLDYVDSTSTEVINIKRDFERIGKIRAELDFFMVNGQTKRLEFTSRYKVLNGNNMTIFRNVSESRLMEKKLRENEQKFRKIFECALEGIILWDEEFNIIDVNPVACEILKVDKREFLSNKINKIVTNFKSCLSSDSFSSNKIEEVYEERRIILGSGEERIIEVAIRRDIIPNLNMSIFRDVTEQKNIELILRDSEHKFRKLYDNAINGFIIIDDYGNIVDLNPESKRIFGLESEIILPLKLQNFAFMDEDEREERWGAFLKNVNLTDHFTVNNRIIEYTLSKNIYRYHHLVILQDVTERKEMEEKLRKSDTLTIVGELAAGIAHEIRNPMTALKGFIHLLQGNVKEDFSMYFEVITSELKRIESIITEFLVLAKPQAIQYQRRDLNKILQETIDLLTPQAALENIQFEMKVEGESTEIHCEANQLKQVFINIIKNGIEVMPKGGIIHTSIVHHEKDIVEISFKDQGCGISEDKIKRLGEPFYTTKERGTGLGLMVSYKIIAEHKGKIEVSSEEGKGTTFHIYLPTHQKSE